MSKDVRKALMIAKGQVSSGYLPPGDPQREANLARHMEGSAAPATLYHGTPVGEGIGDIHSFDRTHAIKRFNRPEGLDAVGTWLDESPGERGAGMYAGTEGAVYPVHASLKNPWKPKSFDEFLDLMHTTAGRDPKTQNPQGRGTVGPLRDYLMSKGHDSIMFPPGAVDHPDQGPVWVSLHPESQLKSAVGNAGQFDQSEPEITKAEGGEVDDQPTLYSAAARAAGNLPQAKGPASQMINTLKNQPGVKPEELEYSGVSNAFQPNQPVTKDQLAQHFEVNAPKVTPIIKSGADTKFGPGGLGGAPLPGGENYKEMLLQMPKKTDYQRVGVTPNGAIFTEKDLENPFYRRTAEKVGLSYEMRDMNENEQYKSPHFDEPNILAHLRFDDRAGPNGEKVMHIAEVQSDWHQKGRKQGYKLSEPEYQRLSAREQELISKGHDATPEEKQEWANIKNRLQAQSVPDAPFKATWHELAMKHALRHAAENGYDMVSWDTGDTNADRYDLSKHINTAAAISNKDGTYNLVLEDKNGQEIHPYASSGHRVTPEELENTVGKDVAQKLIEGAEKNKGRPWPSNMASNPEFYNLRGVDLKVGGKGMRGFYDKILPPAVNKMVKKHGVKVEDGKIVATDYGKKGRPADANPAYDVYHKVHSLVITPSMRQEIMRGQPTFQRGGSITKAEGGAVEETVPEAPHTLESQLQAFLQGKRKAVLYTHEEPAPPEGAQRLETAHGVFHYNPALIDERSIKAAVAGDRINEILGYGPYSKKDVLNRVTAGDTPLAVVGRDAEGREVVAAAGTHGTANEQASAIAAQLPTGGQVHIESPQQVISERIAALRSPEQGNKDARKALMIARAMGGRIAKAGGGELPLVGPTPAMAQQNLQLRSQVPLETVYQGEDQERTRSWGNIATPPPNQENLLNYDSVAPVYTSRVQELLTNPSALNRMKMGRPQQWVKYLQKGGAKPEEISMYGIGEGDPNTKISRGDVYSRIDGKIPQLREKLLGGGGNKSDLEVNYSDWETEEPDDQWLYDNAVSVRQNEVDDNRHNTDFMAPYAEDAVYNFSKKHLYTTNPNNVQPEQIEGFLHHALEGELISKDTAKDLLNAAKNKEITSDKWHGAIDEMNDSQVAKIEREREKGSRSNGDMADHTKHYEEAVHALHGAANAQIIKHFKDEAMDDRDALEKLTQQEREYYYEDRDSPKTRAASVTNPNGRDLDYEIRDSGGHGGGIYVTDHRANPIGNVDSHDEAEELIRSHAAKNLGLSGTEVGQKNIDKPNVHDVGIYGEGSQYSLPGVTDYREHTLHFDPTTGRDFEGGHYDPNAVVHMRYGTVNDANGKRLLYLDELQSDWHQKGMGGLYDTPEGRSKLESYKDMYEKASKDVQSHRHHILSGLGLSPNEYPNHTADAFSVYMLMGPEDAYKYRHGIFDKYNSVASEDPALAKAMFGENADNVNGPELIKNFQEYARQAFGDDYKNHASDHTSALVKQNNLREAARGDLVPDAPWKNTSEWSKLAMKRALRIAADYGYDGVALSPGWVQKHRWGNEDHQKTYDDLMGGSMRSLAKQEDLNFGTASIPLLRKHAQNNRVSGVDNPDQAHAIYLEDEHKDKIRKKGFKLFKQGGYVPMKNSSAVEQAFKLTSKSGATLPAAVFLARQHQRRD